MIPTMTLPIQNGVLLSNDLVAPAEVQLSMVAYVVWHGTRPLVPYRTIARGEPVVPVSQYQAGSGARLLRWQDCWVLNAGGGVPGAR